MTILKTILLWSVAAVSFAGPGFLPLSLGNEWTYRDAAGSSFTVRVGTPAFIGGNTYYRLIGYATQPLWVREGSNGTLLYRDEEFDRDLPLTSFEPFEGGWFHAPFRPCPEQEGQTLTQRVPYTGGAGPFAAVLRVRYRSFGCGDVGVQEELFLENTGMLRRTVSSIAGPRIFELVYARVGKATLSGDESVAFRVSAAELENPKRIQANLRLSVGGPSPQLLRFQSTQDFDAVLKDAAGNVVWKYSDGKFFLPVVREVEMHEGERVWTVDIPADPGKLAPGKYVLEGWLTSGADQKEFASSVRFDFPQAQPAEVK